MYVSATLAEISVLSLSDRILLMQAIWDTIGAESEQIKLTETQKQELSRRLTDHKDNPSAVVAWDNIKAQALARAICSSNPQRYRLSAT